MTTNSEITKNLLDSYGISAYGMELVKGAFDSVHRGFTVEKYITVMMYMGRLIKYIAKLEAKDSEVEAPKWKTGHPEHPEQVLIKVRYDSSGGEYILEYEVNQWDYETNDWLDPMDYNGTVLGWRDCDDFDLPAEGEK
ncbi:MAG: hypothetical protein KBA03_03670 [Anaerolineaceae bacterium]|nr:hypothetical protein [Anaerolineaceae bacterium]